MRLTPKLRRRRVPPPSKLPRWPRVRTIRQLLMAARAAFAAIARLIEDGAVAVPSAGDAARGWGQYVDDFRRSDRQWGRYGTSAAVRTLASCLRGTQADRRVASIAAVSILHPKLLPDRVPAPDDALKTRDFDRIVKFAFILEGIEPDRVLVAPEDQPEIISHIWTLKRGSEAGWSSRDGSDAYRDRFLPTAIALYALRRFPGEQKDSRAREAYNWLAERVAASSEFQFDVRVLAGLALALSTEATRALPRVSDALGGLDEEVGYWARAENQPDVTRPYFNGFAEYDHEADRESTDYIFLSPEILAARYLLARGIPSSRRYVLRVVSTLLGNIARNTVHEKGGYAVQGNMMRTIDQAWAVDLLEAFASQAKQDPKALLPKSTAWLSKTRFLGSAWATIVIGVIVAILITGATVVPLLTLAAGATLSLFFRAYDRRD